MAHDVFVSYSQKDKLVADAVVAGLERDGIRCWIAPRDIMPGTSWGEAIVDAIGASRVMVLVLSLESSKSPQVIREVERAVSSNVAVLPFRIESVDPTGAMAYFLGTGHWLDALTPPVERHIQRLSQSVAALLGREGAAGVAGAVPSPPPPPAALPWWRRLPVWGMGAGAILVAVLVAVIGLSLGGGGSGQAGTTATTTPATTTPPETTVPSSTTAATTTLPVTTTAPTRYAYIYELEVGDCFDDRNTPLIPIVACDSPHDKEVFAVIDFPEGPYPTNEDMTALCVAEFDRYVDIPFAESVLGLDKFVPSESAWEDGERTIYCALRNLDGSPLVGSAAGTAR